MSPLVRWSGGRHACREGFGLAAICSTASFEASANVRAAAGRAERRSVGGRCAAISPGRWRQTSGLVRQRDIRMIEEWGQRHREALYLNWYFGADRRTAAENRGLTMQYEITGAIPHRDHTVAIAWPDAVRGDVDFMPFIRRDVLFAALREPWPILTIHFTA